MSVRTSVDLDDIVSTLPAQDRPPPGSGVERRLRTLTMAMAREARLSALGRHLAHQEVARWLRARGELEAVAPAATPPAGATAGRAPERLGPVVITGLPRTGTTLLHSLLACIDGTVAPRTWQYDHPAVVIHPEPAAVERARAATTERLAGLARLAPRLADAHPMATDAPEECDAELLLEAESFRALVYWDVPSYVRAWTHGPSDETYRRLAAVVAGLHPTAVPVLKAPGHLAAIGPMLAVWPGAHLVAIHRPADEVVASWASLVGTARRIFSNEVRPAEELAAESLATFTALVDRATDDRALVPTGSWVGIGAGELRADPVGCAEAVAERVGLTVTETARRSMARVVADDLRRPPHRYEAVPADASVERLDRRYRELVLG